MPGHQHNRLGGPMTREIKPKKTAVYSADHPQRKIAKDACRSCGGSGQIVKPKDCPRCEGDGRDRFYSVDRPNC